MSGNIPSKAFDQGVSDTLSNTEFSSGIYEAPQNPTGNSQGTGKKQGLDTEGLGTTAKKVDEVNTDGSISQKKVKDTAGAGAMIL